MWFWLSWGKGGGVLLFGPLEVMGAAPWFSEVLLRGKQHRQSKKPQRKLQEAALSRVLRANKLLDHQ